MNRNVLLPALFGLLLAACGAKPDTIATAVAATVAAYPTRVPISTVVQVSTVIQVAPSETRPPAPTTPPEATHTPAPSITPAPTSTLPPSLTPLPSLTAASDPKASLGAADYHDTFDSGTGWLAWKDDDSSGQVANGQYALSVLQPGIYRHSLRDLAGSDFYLEVTARVGDCKPGDSYGLLYRIRADRGSGYYFAVSCDGQYRLFKLTPDSPAAVPIVNWSGAEAIVKGPNAANVLGLFGQGGQIALYANGQLLGTLTDDTYADGAFTGLYVRSSTAPVTVSFDDFTIWRLKD